MQKNDVILYTKYKMSNATQDVYVEYKLTLVLNNTTNQLEFDYVPNSILISEVPKQIGFNQDPTKIHTNEMAAITLNNKPGTGTGK